MRGGLQDGHHEVRDVPPQRLVVLLFPTLPDVVVVVAHDALGSDSIDFPSFFLRKFLRKISEFQFKRNLSLNGLLAHTE